MRHNDLEQAEPRALQEKGKEREYVTRHETESERKTKSKYQPHKSNLLRTKKRSNSRKATEQGTRRNKYVSNRFLSDVAAQTNFSEDDVSTLADLFYESGRGRFLLRLRHFKDLLHKIPNTHPLFCENEAALAFALFDRHHIGKLNLLEIIRGINVLLRGDAEQKADLAFKSLQNSRFRITHKELKERARLTLKAAKRESRSKQDFLDKSLITLIVFFRKSHFVNDMMDDICDEHEELTFEDWKKKLSQSDEFAKKFVEPHEGVLFLKGQILEEKEQFWMMISIVTLWK